MTTVKKAGDGQVKISETSKNFSKILETSSERIYKSICHINVRRQHNRVERMLVRQTGT